MTTQGLQVEFMWYQDFDKLKEKGTKGKSQDAQYKYGFLYDQ